MNFTVDYHVGSSAYKPKWANELEDLLNKKYRYIGQADLALVRTEIEKFHKAKGTLKVATPWNKHLYTIERLVLVTYGHGPVIRLIKAPGFELLKTDGTARIPAHALP